MGKSAALGLGGALIGFAIDQGANAWERSYEEDTQKKIVKFDSQDKANNICVIATEVK